MSDTESKQAIFRKFQDRQAQRRDEMLAERAAETQSAIGETEIETRMEIGAAVEFLMSEGDREDASTRAA
jgi:hypothetical protein